jgi:hypothetical protein
MEMVSPRTLEKVDYAVGLVEYLLSYGNDEEAAFLEVLAHIADRGDLVEFCRVRNLRVGLLVAWIRRDAERSRRYEQALMDRRYLDAESVRGVWVDAMGREPEEGITWGNKLKASELMGKYAGVLADGGNGGGGGGERASEDELREALRDLLARNPDVKELVFQGSAGGVVETQVVAEQVGGTQVGEPQADVVDAVEAGHDEADAEANDAEAIDAEAIDAEAQVVESLKAEESRKAEAARLQEERKALAAQKAAEMAARALEERKKKRESVAARAKREDLEDGGNGLGVKKRVVVPMPGDGDRTVL